MITQKQQKAIEDALANGDLVWGYTPWGNLVQIRSLKELSDAIYQTRVVGFNKTETVVIQAINKIIVDDYYVFN